VRKVICARKKLGISISVSFLKMSESLNNEQPEVGNRGSHENVAENLHLQPLLLPEILKAVFKHLGRNELKECRLVCKTWNEATIPFTRDEFKGFPLQDMNSDLFVQRKELAKNFLNFVGTRFKT